MTDARLPAAIQTFIDATNAADSAAFAAAFTTDARLTDGGREFHGRDGVRDWDRTDNIGVRAHFDLLSVRPGDGPDSHIVTLTVSGDGYNGTGTMRFDLRDGLIARLTIG